MIYNNKGNTVNNRELDLVLAALHDRARNLRKLLNGPHGAGAADELVEVEKLRERLNVQKADADAEAFAASL